MAAHEIVLLFYVLRPLPWNGFGLGAKPSEAPFLRSIARQRLGSSMDRACAACMRPLARELVRALAMANPAQDGNGRRQRKSSAIGQRSENAGEARVVTCLAAWWP